jgi:hypothetical protein
MAVSTVKYVRKPLYVDAVKVTKENFEDILEWSHGELGGPDGLVEDDVPIDTDKHYIRIRVHNPQTPRQTRAFVGDWILYTPRGYKIYTEKAFTENFDKAEK